MTGIEKILDMILRYVNTHEKNVISSWDCFDGSFQHLKNVIINLIPVNFYEYVTSSPFRYKKSDHIVSIKSYQIPMLSGSTIWSYWQAAKTTTAFHSHFNVSTLQHLCRATNIFLIWRNHKKITSGGQYFITGHWSGKT